MSDVDDLAWQVQNARLFELWKATLLKGGPQLAAWRHRGSTFFLLCLEDRLQDPRNTLGLLITHEHPDPHGMKSAPWIPQRSIVCNDIRELGLFDLSWWSVECYTIGHALMMSDRLTRRAGSCRSLNRDRASDRVW